MANNTEKGLLNEIRDLAAAEAHIRQKYGVPAGARLGWHFVPKNKKLRYRDGREVKVGETLSAPGAGRPRTCTYGMHASPTIKDAIEYMPKPTPHLCLVWVQGQIDEDNDKFSGEHRHCIAMVDFAVFEAAWEQYEAVERAAWEQYGAVEQPAWEQYEAVKRAAWEQYGAVAQPARQQYEAVKRAAWEQYEAVERAAWEQYGAVEQPAWEQYEAVKRAAWEQYGAVAQPARQQYEAVEQPARQQYEAVKRAAWEQMEFRLLMAMGVFGAPLEAVLGDDTQPVVAVSEDQS